MSDGPPETPAEVGAAGTPFDDTLLAEIRGRFHHVDRCPYTGPRIFFENGGGSLKLKAALSRGAEVAALPDQEARDNDASRALTTIIDKGLEDLRLLFGSDEGQVISGPTGTELIYKFVRAVALSAPAGPVMSCALEHPASFDAARQWAERTGRPWIEVPFDPRSGTVEPADYAARVVPETRLATVCHTSQLTGMRVDIAGVAEAIRAVAPECCIVVDAIQHAPHGAIAVDDYGVDAYVFSPYKAYSRLAVGFAWLSDRLAAVPHEHMLGGHTQRWELGSRDPGMYASQSEVVAYLCWLGSQFTRDSDRRTQLLAAAYAMADHERYLIDLLLSGEPGLQGLDGYAEVTVIGPTSLENREGIISFTLAGLPSPELVRRFAARSIRVHARVSDAYSGHILAALGLPDCLRVSLCHYNSPDEVRDFLAVLAEIVAELAQH
jgi:selenocysteine lyase/cysteine desulfurase